MINASELRQHANKNNDETLKNLKEAWIDYMHFAHIYDIRENDLMVDYALDQAVFVRRLASWLIFMESEH